MRKDLAPRDELAGREAKCPNCGSVLTIPAPDVEDDDEGHGFGSESPAPAYPVESDPVPALSRYVASRVRPAEEADPFAPKGDFGPEPAAGSIREFAYGLLIFALVPLAFSLLSGEERRFQDRLKETLDRATPEQVKRVEAAFARGRS